jgi:hypothetical protein
MYLGLLYLVPGLVAGATVLGNDNLFQPVPETCKCHVSKS